MTFDWQEYGSGASHAGTFADGAIKLVVPGPS